MSEHFLGMFLSPESQAAQRRAYGRSFEVTRSGEHDRVGPAEAEFLARRDSFYMATVTSDGWPYVQHRGGPAGFLRVLNERTLGFADLRGNRQLISTGNLDANGRVALILVDYPRRERLKIVGVARALDAREHPALVERLTPADRRSKVERLIVIDVHGFDWNCPQNITPRYTLTEVEEAARPLHEKIAALEAELALARGARGG